MEPHRLILATAISLCVGSAPCLAKTLERQFPKFSHSVVKRQFKTAAKLVLRAAKKGNVEAIYRLGVLYRLGQGVPLDLPRARQHFQLAADNGHAGARLVLKRWPAQRVTKTTKQDAGGGSGGIVIPQYPTAYVFEVNAVEPGKVSLAELAGWRGNTMALHRLAASGLDLFGGTDAARPLIAAAAAGKKDIVSLLLEEANETSLSTEDLVTALLGAAASGNEEVVAEILHQRPDLAAGAGAAGPQLMAQAVTSCSAGTVLKLAEAGFAVFTPDMFGEPLLVIAARRCNGGVAENLVRAGANINVAGAAGRTGLWYAAVSGDIRLARVFLSAGAHLDAADHYGSTPLHAAAAGGHQDVVMELLEAGANVNEKSTSGQSPLSIAVNAGHEPIVQALIARRADVNQRLAEDRTPLMVAAMNGNRQVVSALLAAGADPSLKDSRHRAAEQYASIGGYKILANEISNATN